MLDFLVSDNKWQPPKLTSEVLAEYCKQATTGDYSERDFLVIFKTEPYIDTLLVHINSRNTSEPVYRKRFTFQNGFVWDSETERIFVDRCLNNPRCGYAYTKLDDIYSIYSNKYPDWKLNKYYTKPFRLLDHIYHCMRKNTAKEMLYKAGLDELAANIEDMDEIDLLSSRPSDIYEGVSMRTLRALNCREGATLLSLSYNRKFLKDLQVKFPEIFRESLNDAQCSYLNHLITGDLTVGEVGRLFKARRLKLLLIWNDSQYKMFLLREKSKKQARDTIKELSEIDSVYSKNLDVDMESTAVVDYRISQLKVYLLAQRVEYDKMIRRSNRRRESSWQERGKGFIVRYPQTINDFCREAVYMNNCLLTYVDAIINGDTTILFVRREDDVNTPFITMEIFGNELMQAYHRFNQDCTPQEAKWIREYCKRHGIGCSKFRFDNTVDELF